MLTANKVKEAIIMWDWLAIISISKKVLYNSRGEMELIEYLIVKYSPYMNPRYLI